MTVRNALNAYLALATGVTDLTRQKALSAARALVSQGEATAEQVTGLAEDLLAQTLQNREAVTALVRSEVDRALARVGLGSAEEVAALSQRVRELEAQLRASAAVVGAGPVDGAGTPGAGARTSAGGGAALEVERPDQVPAKESPSGGASAEKAATKKAAPRKSASGEARAKKAATKKAPTKKAPAEKAAAEKAPAEKAPAKRAPAKRAPTKRAPAKRAPGKESPPKTSGSEKRPETGESPA